jgi:signal transduction histidine kinase
VALAGLVGLLVVVGSVWNGSTAVGVLVGAGLCAPLVWRRRAPLATLGILACGSLLYLAMGDPSPGFVPPAMVALYTVAAWGSRARTLAVAAGLLPYVAVIVFVFSLDEGGNVAQLVETLSQLGMALAVGEAVRSQRAFVAAVRDRAERAAHEHELETRQRLGEERVRIARDVHDVVAHSIATISTQASVGVHVGREEPARAVEVLESIKTVSAEALHDLRYALGVLRDASGVAPVAPTPSMDDLPALVQRARDSGLVVELRMEGAHATLSAATQVAVYRIVQEGLTNVMRHAAGARVTVRVAVRDQEIEVEVSDDGAGEPSASSGADPGSGLVGMRERASAMGGELQAGRDAHGGFRVRARLPMDQEPA